MKGEPIMESEIIVTLREAFAHAKEVIDRFFDALKKALSFFEKKEDEA